jgi:hypothetical protein
MVGGCTHIFPYILTIKYHSFFLKAHQYIELQFYIPIQSFYQNHCLGILILTNELKLLILVVGRCLQSNPEAGVIL